MQNVLFLCAHSKRSRLNSGVINNVTELHDESRIRRALILSWHVARLSLCKSAGVPVCQRSSVRWSVWWKSSQNRASSQSAALRSSTCGGSTCCTLCGPTQANSQVFKYNVDFTYDFTRSRMRQCLFFISASVNSAEGLALTAQKPSAFHLDREKPYAVQSDYLLFSGEGSGKWR